MSNPVLTARILQVVFGDTDQRSYAYYTTDETIEKGDLVVVVAPHNRDGNAISLMRAGTFPEAPAVHVGFPKIVRVVSTEETVEGIEAVREWIVCKLDFADYMKRRESEEKRKLLNAKIKRAVDDAKKELDLSDLASRSPALAALLKERDELA